MTPVVCTVALRPVTATHNFSRHIPAVPIGSVPTLSPLPITKRDLCLLNHPLKPVGAGERKGRYRVQAAVDNIPFVPATADTCTIHKDIANEL